MSSQLKMPSATCSFPYLLPETPKHQFKHSPDSVFRPPLKNTEQKPETEKKRKGPGRKPNFSPEDDTMLTELVKTHGDAQWSLIASIMKKWNRKQLRDHYVNFIKFKHIAQKFSNEEDALIVEAVRRYGHAWKKIAGHLPGKSPMAIKNRYYKRLIKMSPQQKTDSSKLNKITRETIGRYKDQDYDNINNAKDD